MSVIATLRGRPHGRLGADCAVTDICVSHGNALRESCMKTQHPSTEVEGCSLFIVVKHGNGNECTDCAECTTLRQRRRVDIFFRNAFFMVFYLPFFIFLKPFEKGLQRWVRFFIAQHLLHGASQFRLFRIAQRFYKKALMTRYATYLEIQSLVDQTCRGCVGCNSGANVSSFRNLCIRGRNVAYICVRFTTVQDVF